MEKKNENEFTLGFPPNFEKTHQPLTRMRERERSVKRNRGIMG